MSTRIKNSKQSAPPSLPNGRARRGRRTTANTIAVAESIKSEGSSEEEFAGWLHFTTYDELVPYIDAFAEPDSKIRVFLLVSDPGLCKTTLVRMALNRSHWDKANRKAKWCEITSGIYAPGFYIKGYEHLNQPFFFNDPYSLVDGHDGQELLLQFCDTVAHKVVKRNTKEMRKKNAPAPTEYITSSRSIFALNKLGKQSSIIRRALVSRADVRILFTPSFLEVHRYVAGWFWDQEIHDYIGSVMPYLTRPDCRIYDCVADRQKQAGLDWRRAVRAYCFHPDSEEATLVRLMIENPKDKKADVIRKMVGLGVGSQASLYRHFDRLYADLKERVGLKSVPRYVCQGKRPKEPPPPVKEPLPNDADKGNEQ